RAPRRRGRAGAGCGRAGPGWRWWSRARPWFVEDQDAVADAVVYPIYPKTGLFERPQGAPEVLFKHHPHPAGLAVPAARLPPSDDDGLALLGEVVTGARLRPFGDAGAAENLLDSVLQAQVPSGPGRIAPCP